MDGMVSGVFHCIYNLASITVLESFSPVTHAVLNLSKRAFVIMMNLLYFKVPLTWSVLISLSIFLFGCYLYQLGHTLKAKCIPLKAIIIFAFMGYLLGSSSPMLTMEREPKTIKCLPPKSPGRISTAWVFDRPITESVVINIDALAGNNSGTPFYVYCGTTQCVNSIAKLKHLNVVVKFMVIPELVKDTPLEHWLARHTFNKLIAGTEFENHLHDVVRLGILWKYGGIFVDPTVRVLAHPACPGAPLERVPNNMDAWVSGIHTAKDGIPGSFDVMFFTQNHPFISQLAEIYNQKYPIRKNEIVQFQFHNMVSSLFSDSCRHCPNVSEDLLLKRVHQLTDDSLERGFHYGTLSYNTRVAIARDANLGDEVQGFPGIQFLPFVDVFVERDNLRASSGNGRITVFFNAWWGSSGADWPPPTNVDPVMLSIHIAPGMQRQWERHIGYLKQREPVGCRDSWTLDLLRTHGVKAYFSGCLTLMLNNPNIGQRSDHIYISDVSQDLVKLLPLTVQKKAVYLKHNIEGSERLDSLTRFSEAYKLMQKYGSAKLVVTQRIHCALPCVAMGTPVIFINSPNMPGGGGTKIKSSSRITGLSAMFHTLDMYNMSRERAQQWLASFPWTSPPPNPNLSMVMRLRATAWNVIRQNHALYDAAKKFGVVPMVPPPAPIQDKSKNLVFHLIFTTSNKTLWKLFSSKGNHTYQRGFFNWRHRRSIESIYYHHPRAKVMIHSNTLSQKEFAVFTEVGYSLEVKNYSLKALLTGSPAESFIKRLSKVRNGMFWYSHETDLLRCLILYKWGGVYMDTDMVIVRPVDTLKMNIVAWQGSQENILNGAFMMFEKGNPYLKECLQEFARTYRITSWGWNGPYLLTRILKEKQWGSSIHVVNYQAFYMFKLTTMLKQCFEETSGKTFDANMRVLKTKAYGVHLNSKLTVREGMNSDLQEGSICKHILNSFCILCNNLH